MSPEEKLKNATLLIVEDDPEALEALTVITRTLVKKVLKASNGAEGLKMVQMHNPDLVLSDLQMPVMTGMEMIERIKATHPQKPIIVVTIFSDESHKVPLADRQLYKPIDRNELRRSLFELAERL